MKHTSLYLDWYLRVPSIKHDFHSSGITYFKYDLDLGEIDLSANFVHGNPDTTKLIARRYEVKPENVFLSSEGASGQNARIIRYLAEKNSKKKEAIMEYPTYEPLLRQVQEHFFHVKRLERREKNGYRIDVDELRRTVSEKTGLLVITNPHAPSGAICTARESREIMSIAREHRFYVLCDEIYAEFDRNMVPTLFSFDPDWAVVTSSFTKAYGLGGLKLGVALADKELVDELYVDVLNTVGNSPNIVQLIATELFTRGRENLERHKQQWANLKRQTEKWLDEKELEYFPDKVGMTYWVRLPVKDTCKWTNDTAIPHYSVAPVPGTFFLFNSNYEIVKSNMIRLGLGGIIPEKQHLEQAFEAMEKALNERCSIRG